MKFEKNQSYHGNENEPFQCLYAKRQDSRDVNGDDENRIDFVSKSKVERRTGVARSAVELRILEAFCFIHKNLKPVKFSLCCPWLFNMITDYTSNTALMSSGEKASVARSLLSSSFPSEMLIPLRWINMRVHPRTSSLIRIAPKSESSNILQPSSRMNFKSPVKNHKVDHLRLFLIRSGYSLLKQPTCSSHAHATAITLLDHT